MPDAQINTGTSLDSVVGGLSGLSGQPMSTPTYRKNVAEEIKGVQSDEKQIKELGTAAPPKLDPQPEMKDYQTDPMKTFGSFGMVMAALGSALTRHPLTTALNAGAEVYQAQNKNDLNAYNDAFAKWKINAENGWKQAEWQRNQINDIYERLKGDEQAKHLELELLGKYTDDPSLKAAKETLDYDNLKITKEKNVAELKKIIDENTAKQKVLEGNVDDYIKQHPRPDGTLMTAKEIPAKDQGKIFEDTERDWAQAKKGTADIGTMSARYDAWKEKKSSIQDANDYANGAPISNIIRSRGKDGGEQLQMIKDLAEELHPGFDRNETVQDYNAANKAISAFGNGKQGDIVRSLNVAYSHINLVSDLAKALDNGDVKSINSLSQNYEEQFGSPAPTNFDAAKRILADEITKAVIGSAGALTDREGTADTVSRANSFSQTEGGLDTFKGLMRGQLSGLQRQYEQATKRKDFDRLLGDDVKDDLKKFKDKKGGKFGELKTYSPTEYKEAIANKTLQKGDRFLDSKGIEHEVQ